MVKLIITVAITAIVLILTLYFTALHFLFKNRKNIDKTFGKAKNKKTKHNVTHLTSSHMGTHAILKTFFVKVETSAVYVYTVNGKEYKKRLTRFNTSFNQMPRAVTIVFLKKLPFISYIKDNDIGGNNYSLYAQIGAFCLPFLAAMLVALLWL